MVIDMIITDIAISVFLILTVSWGIFQGYGTIRRHCKKNDKNVLVQTEPRHIVRDIVPVINVIFTPNAESEDELSKELADMFITQRTYYYSGKPVPEANKVLPEKEAEIFVKFDNVSWDILKLVDV